MLASGESTNFVFFRGLFRSLRAHGLNPREWQIDRLQHQPSTGVSKVEFIHRSDQDFRVDGRIVQLSSSRTELRGLRVISL